MNARPSDPLTMSPRRRAFGYLTAIVATFATLGVRLAMDTTLGGRPMLVIFTIPIMLSGYVGGMGPGLLATAVSFLAASFFLLQPIHSFVVASITERWQQVFVVIAGVVISGLNEALHRARYRADQATAGHQHAQSAITRLAAIVESSDDAIISKDFTSTIISWNGGAEKIFGYTSAEMLGTSIMRLIPPDRQKEEEFILAQIKRGEFVHNFETLRRTKSGRMLDVSITVSPVKDALGQIVGASKIVRDISVQKAHEREILRLTRLYSALSQVNQAIVVARDRDALFAKICRVLVENGGCRMAWIGLLDPITQRVHPASQWGDQIGYDSESEVYADERPEGQGPVGTAIREGRTYVCSDFAADPRTLPWREAAARAGYRASAVFPIRLHGAVCGSIAVYAGEIGFFKDREIALLEEAAGDVSFGLDNLAREEVRQVAEQALRNSEERYRTLFETLIEGFCTIEVLFNAAGKAVDYRFLELNPAFEKQTGWKDAEGKLMRDLAPGHEDHWFEIFGKIALTGEAAHFESEAKAMGRHYDVCAYRVGGPDSRRVAILFNDITERKRTEQAILASEEYFRFLNNLVEATRPLANPEEIMSVTARLLGEHLHVSRCAYADVEKDSDQFTILHDYTDGCASTVGQYQLSLFGPRAVATLLSGQTLIVRNVDEELLPGEGAEMFRAIGIQAIITCPLASEGSLRAMMAVHQSTARDWQPDEITLVQDVVERCWATIERRRADQKNREQMDELLRWQNVMVNRENRVETLKSEVNEQLARQAKPPRYASPAAL